MSEIKIANESDLPDMMAIILASRLFGFEGNRKVSRNEIFAGKKYKILRDGDNVRITEETK